jgi:cholera toxin transcriptional activator
MAIIAHVSEELPIAPTVQTRAGFLYQILATPDDLPKSSHSVVQTLFVPLQLMYLGFYVRALANLIEINDIFSTLSFATWAFPLVVLTDVLLNSSPYLPALRCALSCDGNEREASEIRPFLSLFDVL